MMKYEEMSDFEINKRVADIIHPNMGKCLLPEVSSVAAMLFHPASGGARSEMSHSVNYTHNPSDAWPIITGNMISIEFDGEDQCDEPVSWVNARSLLTDDVCMHQSNPLRAAMICFLKMKDIESDQ